MEALRALGKEEVVAWLRRHSSGFSRGASQFRGVTKHHQHGKWEARIGRVDGNRYLVSRSRRMLHSTNAPCTPGSSVPSWISPPSIPSRIPRPSLQAPLPLVPVPGE
jgi:hypothetical protein